MIGWWLKRLSRAVRPYDPLADRRYWWWQSGLVCRPGCLHRTMIQNDAQMGSELPRRKPTYDGSLFGDDVCRCNNHVDPHRHTAVDPLGKSIFDQEGP